MGFFGRLPRLGYLLRLCIISIFYALGGLLVHLALPGEGTSLLGLICLFLGSGFVLLALLLWWFATVRRFHDMNLSGWWFIFGREHADITASARLGINLFRPALITGRF